MGNDTIGLTRTNYFGLGCFLSTKLVERAREVELSRVKISLIQANGAARLEDYPGTSDAIQTGQNALPRTAFHVGADRPHGEAGLGREEARSISKNLSESWLRAKGEEVSNARGV